MKSIEHRVAQEAKAVTRKEVILKAIERKLSWLHAADILGITPRHIRRLKKAYEYGGWGGLRDHRAGILHRKRLPPGTIRELLRLRRERYADFSIRHFYDFATEKHGLKLSYTWTRIVLQESRTGRQSSRARQIPPQARKKAVGGNASTPGRLSAPLA